MQVTGSCGSGCDRGSGPSPRLGGKEAGGQTFCSSALVVWQLQSAKSQPRVAERTRYRWNMPSVLKYRSGEEIRKGDRVRFHGNPAEVEFVACDPDVPQAVWY